MDQNLQRAERRRPQEEQAQGEQTQGGSGPSRPSWVIARPKLTLWLLGALAAVALLWLLRAASGVFIPVTAAFFVAVGVAPVGQWVRDRVPDRLSWLAPAAAMLAILAVLAAFFGSLWGVIDTVAAEFPRHADQLHHLWAQAHDRIASLRGQFLGAAAGKGGGGEAAAGTAPVTDAAAAALSAVQATASTLVLIVFLALLMLVEAPVWRDKAMSFLGRESCGAAMEAVAAIAQQFRRYILVSGTLGIITGALYILWLSLFGIDFVFLWGLLAFLLNFIPLAGSVIAGALPVLLALAQKGSGDALIVGAGVLIIEQVMGNLVAPRLQGRQLAISPLVIMVSLLLWSWLWGAAGALLAVPMTVMIAIMLSHIDALRPFAVVLSDRNDAERFEAHTRPD